VLTRRRKPASLNRSNSNYPLDPEHGGIRAVIHPATLANQSKYRSQLPKRGFTQESYQLGSSEQFNNDLN
jgi:hypothetical protein